MTPTCSCVKLATAELKVSINWALERLKAVEHTWVYGRHSRHATPDPVVQKLVGPLEPRQPDLPSAIEGRATLCDGLLQP